LKSNLTQRFRAYLGSDDENIYNLGGSRLSEEDFKLNIFYQYPPELNYLTAYQGTLANSSVPLPAGVDQTTLIRVSISTD
jgi:hypothetical protein